MVILPDLEVVDVMESLSNITIDFGDLNGKT